MAKKFLDQGGLNILWTLINNKFIDSSELSAVLQDYFTKDEIEQKLLPFVRNDDFESFKTLVTQKFSAIEVDIADINARIDNIPEYTIDNIGSSETYAATYRLKRGDEYVGAAINIAKDQFFQGASVETCQEKGVPVESLEVGDKYLDLKFGSDSEHIQHAYVPIKDMVKPYTAGTSIEITNDNVINVTSVSVGQVEELPQRLNAKVDIKAVGPNGDAYLFNENDGGGVRFVHKDGTESFVGVNDGGQNGLVAQIYADKLINGRYVGSRINVYHDKIYYVNKEDCVSGTAKDNPLHEIATIDSVRKDRILLIDVQDYGFNSNLRVSQTINASPLVRDVINAFENSNKIVVIKAGEYKFIVTEVLNNEDRGSYPIAFSCVGASANITTETAHVYTEGIVFLDDGSGVKNIYSSSTMEIASMINIAMSKLHRVAKTGLIEDLGQNADNTLIFRCTL